MSETETKYERRSLQLDDASMDKVTAEYPEAVREATRWLGIHCRRHFGGSCKLLATKCGALGFNTTESTLSKILRGYWQTDSQGKQTDSPVMREKVFLQLVQTLRADQKRKEHFGKIEFITTPTAQEIFNYIEARRAEEAVCKFGFIYGPTGAQKSASFIQYVGNDESLGARHVEAPSNAKTGEFLCKLMGAYGFPQSGDARRHRQKLREVLNESKCLIIDNVQKLYRHQHGWNQDIFNWLQEVQDETRCAIIMSATVDFGRTMTAAAQSGYLEQFAGRCGGKHAFLALPEFAPEEDIEVIAKTFGLDPDGKRTIKLLTEVSQLPGRIRVLFNALQKAKAKATAKKTTLTLDLIRDEVPGLKEAA